MDIVNRLKFFMDSLQIGNSQFADNCRIPRPTLSQMLNGRNKKVSDEIIAKIHSAYPQLSVLWLMFGEGSMLVDGNTPTSEPQNAHNIANQASVNNDHQRFTSDDGQQNIFASIESEKTDAPNIDIEDPKSGLNVKITSNPTGSSKSAPDLTPRLSLSLDPNQLSAISSNATKKIANIVVFYTDNSFQSFSPTD